MLKYTQFLLKYTQFLLRNVKVLMRYAQFFAVNSSSVWC
jgi:hypothetical protein